jgi:hypothetical protein
MVFQNPQVTIEDWPDPPSDSDGSVVSDTGNDPTDKPTNSPDQDPPFIESGYHEDDPLDEATLSDKELRRVAELHLIDDTIDDEEWMHLCKFFPSHNIDILFMLFQPNRSSYDK